MLQYFHMSITVEYIDDMWCIVRQRDGTLQKLKIGEQINIRPASGLKARILAQLIQAEKRRENPVVASRRTTLLTNVHSSNTHAYRRNR